MLFGDRGIDAAYSHVLRAIEPGKKLATSTRRRAENWAMTYIT